MELKTPVFSLSEQELLNMEQRFKEKLDIGSARRQELFGVFDEPLTAEERFSLQFLYAYMPLNDMADYSGELFLSHVRQALATRRQMEWGSRIPDSVFLHFVLPYRVNNENIEDYRRVIHEELGPRVQGLTMEEAILEANYWCHEKATYIGSDLRTLSPIGMIRSARGRCGEESTLCVSALRSIGIPARQCYTPRWAHCDDNHAWVEAWADGKWHYIGACEPEARLDQGWFSGPARRAMLVHSRVPAQYTGPEDITYSDKWHTEINLLDNYAPARTITVSVRDSSGAAVSGATVQFLLYNYAELYPLAQLETDTQGEVSFKTGYGELFVRAAHKDRWGQCQLTAAEAKRLEIMLSQTGQPQASEDFIMVPPPEIPDPELAPLTEEALERHAARVAEGAAIRAAYEATFISEPEAVELARGLKLPEDRVWAVLEKARGNSQDIAAFLKEQSPIHGEWALKLLEALNDKDLIDTGREVLVDHLEGAMPLLGGQEEEVFSRYILRPRVYYEMLTPYRKAIQAAFTAEEAAEFREDPSRLVEFLNQEWEIRDDLTHLRGKAAPGGTFALKKGDSGSIDLCFVAVCRSLGIPARLHPSELYPQYKAESGWQVAEFEGHPRTIASSKQDTRETGTLCLISESESGPEASYNENFTLARLENGIYKTLIYPHAKKDFAEPLEVEAGEYRLTTGIRLKEGTVYGRFAYFELQPGKEITVPITFHQPEQAIPVLGQVDPAAGFTAGNEGAGIIRLGDQAADKGAVVAFVDPSREPSKHLLRESAELAEAFDAAGAPLLFVTGGLDMAALAELEAAHPGLPSIAGFVLDPAGESLQAFAKAAPLGGSGYPYLYVLDHGCRIRYQESGYKPGSGKEALGILTGIQSN
ncbi:transglutaminase [Paenibacillus yonginensis]|uniref:Transglutaminase n=1 Tax=Paenibacillus yonginensis TaxID=1462996 RepID=A0A1B1N618_9BACL|nr:transglutaminase domain-containing protein [Paenibacillus yonginensis]ANS76898.1 transglutaminase [Paenibacillus yonginensis]